MEPSAKEILLRTLEAAWDRHPFTCLTTAAGFVLALLFIIMGFWATLLLLLLTVGGFAFGRWVEADERRLYDLADKIEGFLRRRRK